MPHVTFIHGIANKPPAGALHDLWLRGLSLGGLNLPGQGVTSTMVYWADVLHAAPRDPFAPTDESLSETELGEGTHGPEIPHEFDSAEERAFVEGLAAKLALADDEDAPAFVPADPALERIPIPWLLKQRMMRVLLRDAHHYLFDAEHEPRPGTRYRVQTEIRRRTLDALQSAPASGPHVVVAHSLGSVIAYDVLQRVADAPAIDALLTLGSPLGIDEVQDRLQPGWTRADGFPTRTVRTRWVNVFDPIDLVCLLDPRLSNDFRRDGAAVVEDLSVTNAGSWRHSYEKYAGQPALTARLADLLRD
ncbi:hypothetical protein [Rubrivirga litoralis]|uniref:Uncharacterized protein n=1 Tax=Rubrivirga litoralis TaxID=3075598 RepID=A0ABU3BRP8_9BACT|nr:hypothetical protein [Rubrivirga sp. F394]MDT0631964.1 hypothetical protein [Rubrivirga sp. F394]